MEKVDYNEGYGCIFVCPDCEDENKLPTRYVRYCEGDVVQCLSCGVMYKLGKSK